MRKLLGLINTVSKVRRHKTNIYKPAFFSQANDEHAEKTNGAISFTIALKMCGINSTKKVKVHHRENFKNEEKD